MSGFSKNLCVAVMLASLAWSEACSLNDGGLGGATDGSLGGSSDPAVCPTGMTDRASWPAGVTYISCTQTCGPDGIGLTTCGQTNLATCQAASGCVCSPLAPACVTCANCTLRSSSDCYQPINANNPPDCAASVVKDAACSSPCGKQLCIQADGKTGCVCNAHGKYACAFWSGTAWK
jgi:hypothetical protein